MDSALLWGFDGDIRLVLLRKEQASVTQTLDREVTHGGCRICRWCGDRFRGHRARGEGGRETVIVFTVVSVLLGVGSLAYLLVALVKPEWF